MSEKRVPTPDEKDAQAKNEALEGEELTEDQLEHVAGGTSNVYLKLTGIDGESGIDAHKKSIEIESFSWGAASTPQTSLKR
jgi:hypothetical protein